MEAVIVELIVYAVIVIVIIFAALYALWLVTEVLKVCWWNFEECPLKSWAESLLNQTFFKVGDRAPLPEVFGESE